MERGFTVIEIIVVTVLVTIATAIVAPAFRQVADRLAVRRSVRDIEAFYHGARMAAVYRSSRIRVVFTPDSLVAVLAADGLERVLRHPGPAVRGVRFTATRAAISIGPSGIGYGAANTKLVLQRGTAADSLATSRLGRMRRMR